MAKKLKITDLTDDTILSIKSQRVAGKTVAEISAGLGITRRTLDVWRKKSKPLDDAMNEAKQISTLRIGLTATEALIEKLKGRKLTEKTITKIIDPSGKLLKTKVTTKTRTIEPSDSLIMYALPRINPKLWDSLALQRLNQGADDSDDYGEFIDKILDNVKNRK